jgi:chemotaxis protein methyltransferase CheR
MNVDVEVAAPARAGDRPQKSTNDFVFTERDFRYIADRIGGHAGIVLNEIKKDLVYGRLVKRLRALGLRQFSDYCKLLDNDQGDEFEQFVNSLTTNLTGFYRESHHFDHLQQSLLPAIMSRKGDKALRIWSAGCSTGAEPYSIALAIKEKVPADWDVKILATDIDTGVLETARQGIYEAEWVIKGLGEARAKRWMMRGSGNRAAQVRVKDELRDMVTFRTLNLLEAWPMSKTFDMIFCRNVVIYFDKPTQAVLFDRMADQLRSDGYLFIGHSESLNKVCDRFKLIGKTIHQRIR